MISLIKRNILGIEITDSSIKLCEVRLGGSRAASLRRFAQIDLPDGAMNDGRIQDEALLQQAFRVILDRHPWPSKRVQFAIPSQTVMVRILKMPNVADKELRKLVDFEMKNNIHLPFDDPYYDFVRLELPAETVGGKRKKRKEAAEFQAQWEAAATRETPGGGNPFASVPDPSAGNMCDVMLVAASMELLQQYIRIFDELGLTLAGIEIKAFTLTRLLALSGPIATGDLALLADVNRTNCDLTIVKNGIIQITRNVPVAFAPPQKAQDNALDQLFADFSPQKAGHEASFGDLAGEMERFMNFYRYTLNHRDDEFQRVVLSGDIPMLDELSAFLGNRLTQPVVQSEWPALRVPDQEEGWSLAAYAVPLGLCLRRGS